MDTFHRAGSARGHQQCRVDLDVGEVAQERVGLPEIHAKSLSDRSTQPPVPGGAISALPY